MIYFVRHAESEENVRRESADDGEILSWEEWKDTGLTKRGREQARETAEKMKDKKIDVMVTSGLRRVKETGEIINRYHGAPVVVMEELNEREDRESGVTTEEFRRSFGFGEEVNSGIERLEDFRDRVVRAIEEIELKYGEKNVLVVSSGGVSHVFRRYFGSGVWEGNIREVHMANGEVVEFEFNRKKEPKV